MGEEDDIQTPGDSFERQIEAVEATIPNVADGDTADSVKRESKVGRRLKLIQVIANMKVKHWLLPKLIWGTAIWLTICLTLTVISSIHNSPVVVPSSVLVAMYGIFLALGIGSIFASIAKETA